MIGNPLPSLPAQPSVSHTRPVSLALPALPTAVRQLSASLDCLRRAPTTRSLPAYNTARRPQARSQRITAWYSATHELRTSVPDDPPLLPAAEFPLNLSQHKLHLANLDSGWAALAAAAWSASRACCARTACQRQPPPQFSGCW